MIYRVLSTLLACLAIATYANGQQARSFPCGGGTVAYLAQNNRMENVFSMPGFQVFIMVADSAQPIEALYAADKMRLISPAGMGDYACFYYLPNHVIAQGFQRLDTFINHIYDADFIDRNRIAIVIGPRSAMQFCATAQHSSNFDTGVYVLGEGADNPCPEYLHMAGNNLAVWRHSQASFENKPDKYSVPMLVEMEQAVEQRKQQQRQFAASHFGKKAFAVVSVGPQHISGHQRVAFDTATLVDFTDYKAVWSFSGGYHLTDRVAVQAGFSFLYSGKQKQVDSIDWDDPDGIKITGSGKAAAMYRYGLGLRVLPIVRPAGSLFVDMIGGQQRALAGGGTATRIIGGGGSNTNVITKQQRSGYCLSLSGGGVFMVSPLIGLHGALSFNHAPLKSPIGSVEGFSGWSVSFGLSFYFNTQKRI